MNEGKTFRCVICGEQVSKRQSVAYGETHLTESGVLPRACRKHPEVMVALQTRLAAEETNRQNELNHKMQEKARREHRYEYKIPTGPSCWHCKTEGIHAQEHFLRMMIANEKCALKGKTFLDREAMIEAYGPICPVLLFVKVWEGHDLVKRTRDGDMFWGISGGNMLVCRDCAAKFNLLPEWDKVLQPADITTEALHMMAAISPLLPITHVVKAVASAELAAEANMIVPFGETHQ